jgi:non-haem Fe2+, alpha-ketoglutarate-dependent halogenase
MKSLSPAAVSHYDDRGYYAPVRVLSPAEAIEMRLKLEAHEQIHGPLKGPMRHKSHLLSTWLDDLIRHPMMRDSKQATFR